MTIDTFFKKRDAQNLETSRPTSIGPSNSNVKTSIPEHRPSKVPRVELEGIYISSLEPRLRRQISDYPINQQDEIRRAYIKAGPYQHIASEYPQSKSKHRRRFQASCFKLFPDWLEYSPTKDAAFCLSCYLFCKPTGRPGSATFIVDGFQSWKKVNNGENCAFLTHVGKRSKLFAQECCEELSLSS